MKTKKFSELLKLANQILDLVFKLIKLAALIGLLLING